MHIGETARFEVLNMLTICAELFEKMFHLGSLCVPKTQGFSWVTINVVLYADEALK
jgi:hypothetical protein